MLFRRLGFPKLDGDMDFRTLEEAENERTVPVNGIGLTCGLIFLFLVEPLDELLLVIHKFFLGITSANPDCQNLLGRNFSHFHVLGRRDVFTLILGTYEETHFARVDVRFNRRGHGNVISADVTEQFPEQSVIGFEIRSAAFCFQGNAFGLIDNFDLTNWGLLEHCFVSHQEINGEKAKKKNKGISYHHINTTREGLAWFKNLQYFLIICKHTHTKSGNYFCPPVGPMTRKVRLILFPTGRAVLGISCFQKC